MAEKVITTVGQAQTIETIFVNDGTDIKQATPDLLRESVGAVENVSSLVTVIDTSVATGATVRTRKIGNLVALFGYMTAVNIPANTTVELLELDASIRPSGPVAVACYASPSGIAYDAKAMINASGKLIVRLPQAMTSGSLNLGAVWPV